MDNGASARRDTHPGKVVLDHRESGVAVIRLGSPNEAVVTLTKERMDSLADAIQEVQRARPTGLIITGPNEDMFCAGADISIIRDATDPVFAEGLAKRGQEIFDMLQALPCPTIAAISGPCVGGACELVLACRYRIMTDSKGSSIGLPEIKLGILPGFGGTQRLPRLLGLPKALEIILAGKILRTKQALKIGLIDEIVSFHGMIGRAEAYVVGSIKKKRAPISIIDKALTFTAFGRSFVKKKATAQIAKDTKGFYPAPPAALDCAIYGLEHGMAAGLKNEAKELGRLIVTSESKSLTRLFFLTEGAKSIGKSARRIFDQFQSVVIGAGVMGAGIAGTLARNDSQVILKDQSDESVKRGVSHIKSQIEKLRYLSEQEKSFILNRIEATTKESLNMGNAVIAIEAVFEDLKVKQEIFRDLSKVMPEESILASNTSSLKITDIAAGVPHPERVVGMHFFNPVEKMPLVEIVRGAQTSDKTVVMVAALATKLGKYPIVVNDVPGFLVNRILTPYLAEAAWLLSEGYSIEEIDNAALAFGMPMGPLRLLDEVGLDVAAHVCEIMLAGYGDRMKGPGYESKLVALDRKGRKNSRGFYDFKEDGSSAPADLRSVLGIEKPAISSPDQKMIQERLLLAMVNEAVRCLDEGVAGKPGAEAVNQIDLGSVMGFGFPPFRGGVLFYAESLGAKRIFDMLSKLLKEHGERFRPCQGIEVRARTNRSFIS